MSATEMSTVMLKGGCVVPIVAIELCLDLERRGCTLELDGPGFSIGPKCLLTDDDRQQLQQHRDAVLSIIRYVETAVPA